MAKQLPVEIGDRFYYNNYCVKNGFSLPDYVIVKDIRQSKECSNLYFITGKYERHFVNTNDRIFSSAIFDDPDWVVVKKNSDIS